jgi:hypothetical protein
VPQTPREPARLPRSWMQRSVERRSRLGEVEAEAEAEAEAEEAMPPAVAPVARWAARIRDAAPYASLVRVAEAWMEIP